MTILAKSPPPVLILSVRQAGIKQNQFVCFQTPFPPHPCSGKDTVHETGVIYYEETTVDEIKNARRSLASSNGICSSFVSVFLFNNETFR